MSVIGTACFIAFRCNPESITALLLRFLGRFGQSVVALLCCAVILDSKLSIVFFIRCFVVFLYLWFLATEFTSLFGRGKCFAPVRIMGSEGLYYAYPSEKEFKLPNVRNCV